MSPSWKTVRLAYGQTGLEVLVPAEAVVVEPQYVAGVPDERNAILTALREPIASAPLRDLARSGQTAVIVHTDITRATPNDRILPILIDELEEGGISSCDITLLNALGTHRKQTQAELREMLGENIVDHYNCLQHDAFDDTRLTQVGITSFGHQVRINRTFLDAELRILTGFIEPHFFAGFSAGPKGVLPSIAGSESVFTNHGARMIAHPNAVWGVTEGNPIWEEMLEAARMAGPSFILNVALNSDKQITGVFAGQMEAAHAQGREFVRSISMAPVNQRFDVVITSNSGYPLDQNLYQSVKGMSAAARVVREGGVIIVAAECIDGVPDHGSYADLLRAARSTADLLQRVESPGFCRHDQWQVQIEARIQQFADVYVYSAGLTDQQIADAHLQPCRDIEITLRKLLEEAGEPLSVCVLPEGPITIPYLEAEAT